jgi:thioredoxin-related protein
MPIHRCLFSGTALLVVVAAYSAAAPRAVAASPVVAGSVADSPKTTAWHTDVSTAWQQALKEDRPLLMYISTSSCTHCRKMASTTYANRHVATLIDESVIAVAVDGRRERKLVKKHLVRSYPTTLVIAPDGREVGRFEGYVSPDDFRRRLAQAVQTPNNVQHVAKRPTQLR